MQTSLEILQGLKRRLTITIPSETFAKEYENAVKRIANKAKVDGFRKGKVPDKIVRERFGSDILEETGNKLINNSLYEAYQKEAVVPVSTPEVDLIQAELGKPFEYAANLEVAPTIEQIHFDNVAIEKTQAQVTPAEIDLAINNMAEQFGAFQLKEGPCAAGDRITIDFEGSIDGVPFAGGAAKGHAFILGAGEMIPGFETDIIGMKAGEEKTITVTFPENYHADLASKEAQFKITLHKAEEKVPAIVDESLVTRLGIATGNLDELKAEVSKTLTVQLNKTLRAELHKKIFDQLLELNPIEVPESLVHEEIHHLMDDAKKRFQQMTGQKDVPDLPHDMFRAEAEKRVRISYLIVKLVEQNDIKPDQAEIRKLAEEMAASYENPNEVRDHFLSDKQYYRNLENMVIENAVAALLLDKAKVTLVEKPYAEVVKQ